MTEYEALKEYLLEECQYPLNISIEHKISGEFLVQYSIPGDFPKECVEVWRVLNREYFKDEFKDLLESKADILNNMLLESDEPLYRHLTHIIDIYVLGFIDDEELLEDYGYYKYKEYYLHLDYEN